MARRRPRLRGAVAASRAPITCTPCACTRWSRRRAADRAGAHAFDYGRALPGAAPPTRRPTSPAFASSCRCPARLHRRGDRRSSARATSARSGAGQRYGLSARGLAIDTVGGAGRGVPALRGFWLERPARRTRRRSSIYALLDCAARDRRLPLRRAPGRRDGRSTCSARLFLRAGRREARHRAADQHVPVRREPAARRRLPPRGARLRRPAWSRPATASGCGAR